ncbi:L-type lectin family protein [Levilactobacillus cerevisiae]|uniref:hypothetical protein n=1 Tax=Levilactobacillus cerevisiae TaxID=1704076 RepID=UPI001CDC7354|nr:hypothetical protein [Levilactobacillus cerevisiae]
MKKRWLWLSGVGMILGLFGLSGVAQASDSAVTADLPSSFAIDGLFNTTSTIPNATNTASLVAGNHGLQVTDNTANTNGSAWATSDNKFDLSKDGYFDMWLYFGKNGAKNSGQGMSFVMQNSSSTGFTTFPSASKPAGQALGVWGVDYTNTATTASTIAGLGIQKSWALEFDEQINSSRAGADNDGLDYSYQYEDLQHVASNYPGDAGSYQRNGTQSSGNLYFYYLKHQGAFQTTLSDGAWHHLTLKWTAPTTTGGVTSDTGSMTYTLNDKDPKTGLATTGTSQTVSVDLTKLGINATDSTKQVYWGFTGTTGSLYANNVVAFEHIPGLVNASSGVTVTDTTANKEVTDGGTVNGNDELTYTYNLKYDSGNQSWQNIATKIPTPDGVTFTSGTITYADGTTETVSADELGTNPIAHTLSKNLSSSNKSATITLNGKADAVTSNTSVASASSSFNGTNEVSSVTTPSYTIYPARNWTLQRTSAANTTVDQGASATVTGLATLAGNEVVSNDNVTVHASLDNGQTIDDFTLNGTSSDSTAKGAFNLTIPADKLVTGNNTVSLYVTDDRGNRSNTVTATVTVTGKLAFNKVSPESSFETTQLNGTSMILKRNADWDLSVTNGMGTGTDWAVTAQASKFSDQTTGTELAGEVVWVDQNGNQSSLNEAQTIASGTNTESSETTDVVAGWSDSSGIMLKTSSSALIGEYQGTVTWVLSNAAG